MTTRNCPECRQPLSTEQFHGVALDVCTDCAGLWFDPSELRRLITSDPIGILSLDDHIAHEIKHGPCDASHPVKSLHCPDCSMPLAPFHYEYNSPVQMNACQDCGGFWVLEQELHKLQTWLDHERKVPEPGEAERIEVAKFEMAHDSVMRRQAAMGRLFRLMQVRVPHWFLPIIPLGS